MIYMETTQGCHSNAPSGHLEIKMTSATPSIVNNTNNWYVGIVYSSGVNKSTTLWQSFTSEADARATYEQIDIYGFVLLCAPRTVHTGLASNSHATVATPITLLAQVSVDLLTAVKNRKYKREMAETLGSACYKAFTSLSDRLRAYKADKACGWL